MHCACAAGCAAEEERIEVVRRLRVDVQPVRRVFILPGGAGAEHLPPRKWVVDLKEDGPSRAEVHLRESKRR